jgi:hypothetical protein
MASEPGRITMNTAQLAANPFALMMDPDAVFAALASSDRLARLKSRVCRPLDKPLLSGADANADADVAGLDEQADDEDGIAATEG